MKIVEILDWSLTWFTDTQKKSTSRKYIQCNSSNRVFLSGIWFHAKSGPCLLKLQFTFCILIVLLKSLPFWYMSCMLIVCGLLWQMSINNKTLRRLLESDFMGSQVCCSHNFPTLNFFKHTMLLFLYPSLR